jgi:hypothetical protein
MLAWKGDIFANTSCDKNVSKSVEILKVMLKTLDIGCGDSILMDNVTTIHECCNALDHILRYMPMNCCYVDLPNINDKSTESSWRTKYDLYQCF